MVKKHKIFGNTLDNLVKFAEEELKRENNAIANANSSNIDAKKNSTKKKPMSSRYVVKHVPPEIQEFVQYFTKHEAWTVEGIFRKNSSVKDLKIAKKLIEDEGGLYLDKYEKEDAILVSGLFKNFLAELQGRIIPYEIYLKLKDTKNEQELKEALKELPINNYETLNYINQFILIVNDNCETNYMNLENLSIVIGPNLFELTSDEMVNLNITVVSSEIYKNILRMRKTERDNANGITTDQTNPEKNDKDIMIIKNVNNSVNTMSELPQSITSINEVLSNAASANLTRRNSIIKTIFIDHIKDKIQKRKSSIYDKRRSDSIDDDERLRSDEYRGYDIFSIDDSNSMLKSEPNIKKNNKPLEENSNSDQEDEVIKHHFVENSDDSYTSSIHNQESGFVPDNMETINEESYDSLGASHRALNKNNSEKSVSKSKLNDNIDNNTEEDSNSEIIDESISSESLSSECDDDDDDNDNNDEGSQGKREQKVFQHTTKNLTQDEVDSDNDSESQMSRISSIEDASVLNKNNDIKEKAKLKESLYFDAESNENDENEEDVEDETIEIINNNENNQGEVNNENDNNGSVNSNENNEIFYSTNKILLNDDLKDDEEKKETNNNNEYLTKDEIIRKLSNPNKKETKRKKFSTVGPKSSIRFMLDNENESNLKDAMSTTNLNGNNDPSEFLNKKLENHKNDISRKSLSRNFSRMIKNNNNVFESNMAFINKTFDDNNDDDDESDNEKNNKYANSNYSIFYDKIENSNQDLSEDKIKNDDKNEENSDNEEPEEEQDNSYSNSEVAERVFVPLKGNEESDSQNNEKLINIVEKEFPSDSVMGINKHEKKQSDEITVDESIYDNIKEYKPTHERNGSFSNENKRKPSRKYSKRIPKCISKSSAAAFSMIQFNLENVDVDNVNDNDLDNLDFTKIKAHKHDDSNLSESSQNQSQDQKPTLEKLKSEFFSCEDVINDKNKSVLSIQNSEQKLEVIEENSQSNLALNKSNSSLQQSIPKSPAKPAPPPPSYTKVKTKTPTNEQNEQSITDIFENTEENKGENDEKKEKLISEEIKNRLESKRKKDHRPDDINKMTYKEILKEKKAIKQELILLKSVYSNHHSSKNSYSNNNNDFVSKSMLQNMESSMDANNMNQKIDGNSQLPPLHYNNNSENVVISKKLQKEDIKYMKELYQKYAEIKFMIAKQNMETVEDTSVTIEKLKQEKLALQIKLKNYQEEFVEKNGRPIKTLEDQKPIRQDYLRYKELKKILSQYS